MDLPKDAPSNETPVSPPESFGNRILRILGRWQKYIDNVEERIRRILEEIADDL